MADRLKFARSLADLAARELDRLAGKTPGHAGLIEARANSDAMGGTLGAYAEVLGITLDWLVRGKGALPTAEDVVVAVKVARVKLAAPPEPAPARTRTRPLRAA